MRSSLVWPVDPSSAVDQLRMKKVKVPVRLLMEGGDRLDGALWLVPIVEPASERERVVDLLEAVEPFLPVTSGDVVRLVNKARIVMLDVSSAVDAGLEDEPTSEFSTEQAVIELCGVPREASRVDGLLAWASPPERSRLLDHVNSAGEWMVVERPAGLSLVATRYVRAIILAHPHEG
jgi:hypothetical protein